EALEVGRLLRPSEDCEGPESTAEPGVENVGVVGQPGVTALRASRRLLDPGEAVPVAAGRHRDGVAEPELAADAPVAQVVHPVQVDVGEALRMEAQLAAVDHRDGGL